MEEENKVSEEVTKEVQNAGKGLSIAALVLGILSLVLWCVWYISVPCAILAIIFGIIGKKRAGKGMAVAGLTTGIIAISLWAVLFILAFAFGMSTSLIDVNEVVSNTVMY